MKKYSFLILLLVGYTSTQAQILKLLEQKPSFSLDLTVNEAEAVSDNLELLNISLDYKLKEGKEYTVSAVALNRMKRAVNEVRAETEELAAGEGVIDLRFKFKGERDKRYSASKMETHYIQIEFRRVTELSERLKSLGINSTSSNQRQARPSLTLLYEYKKEWRVDGKVPPVAVILTPIGKARFVRGRN